MSCFYIMPLLFPYPQFCFLTTSPGSCLWRTGGHRVLGALTLEWTSRRFSLARGIQPPGDGEGQGSLACCSLWFQSQTRLSNWTMTTLLQPCSSQAEWGSQPFPWGLLAGCPEWKGLGSGSLPFMRMGAALMMWYTDAAPVGGTTIQLCRSSVLAVLR